MLYRILTEDKNRETITGIVSAAFDGFTLIPATGYWKGKPESSLIIEIDSFGDSDAGPKVLRLAEDIRQANNQQAVLVQYSACSSKLIAGEL